MDCDSVQQRLRGVFVRTVAGIDKGNILRCLATNSHAPEEEWRITMQSRLHGVQGARGIEQRFAFLDARRFGLQIERIGAQARRGRGKTNARASRIFEKCQGHAFAAGQFFRGWRWNSWNGLASSVQIVSAPRSAARCSADGEGVPALHSSRPGSIAVRSTDGFGAGLPH